MPPARPITLVSSTTPKPSLQLGRTITTLSVDAGVRQCYKTSRGLPVKLLCCMFTWKSASMFLGVSPTHFDTSPPQFTS